MSAALACARVSPGMASLGVPRASRGWFKSEGWVWADCWAVTFAIWGGPWHAGGVAVIAFSLG